MHVLFAHQQFPAQFGHIAAHLTQQLGWRCTFVSQAEAGESAGIERIQYRQIGGATAKQSYFTRTFENTVAHAHGIFEALKPRTDLKPDLIVGHSGFGTTIFLRDLFDAPILNYFEYFYRPAGSDLDFRPDGPPSQAQRMRARTRNAMILLDLHNCDAGYAPTQFQKSCFPGEYQPKIEVIFDGVDTRVYRRIDNPPRTIAGRTIDTATRIVTYCSRGLERMRGFDLFMQAAKRIYQQHADVVFLVVGEDRICYGDDLHRIKPYKTLREWVFAQEEYDESKFLFLGRIPPQQLAQVLSLSDAHIYLTVPFVLSWSMMNALACGAVVIGSDTPPVREMITHGETGFLVDFFDVEAIAARTLDVLRDPAAARPIRESAMAMIEERYTLAAVLPRMLALYERVARRVR